MNVHPLPALPVRVFRASRGERKPRQGAEHPPRRFFRVSVRVVALRGDHLRPRRGVHARQRFFLSLIILPLARGGVRVVRVLHQVHGALRGHRPEPAERDAEVVLERAKRLEPRPPHNLLQTVIRAPETRDPRVVPREDAVRRVRRRPRSRAHRRAVHGPAPRTRLHPLQHSRQFQAVAHLGAKLAQHVEAHERVERVLLVVHALHRGAVVEALDEDSDEEVRQQVHREHHEGEKEEDGAEPVRFARLRGARGGVGQIPGGALPVDILEDLRPVSGERHVQRRNRAWPVLEVGVPREPVPGVGLGHVAVQRAPEAGVDVHHDRHQAEDVEHPGQSGEERVH
mmetsp:Transcript_6768/g.27575  ORF Transcript_6768/g.27575 Transcript_6768/m.27575 type:complete len:341 (-) Transcript_6768:2304-3326(-)